MLFSQLPDGQYKWSLIIVIGWAALAWIRGQPGTPVENLTDALRLSLVNPRRYFDQCDCFVIHNPSRRNRELNKPEVKELQDEAIQEIRKRAKQIIEH